jgi:D-glycero-alpha-D-manno-heptose-7-phosphate kinase
VPPYADEEGGAVCNVAINRYATATVALGVSRPPRGGDAAVDPLVRAALRHAGERLAGATASVVSDFPLGAGLGGSSAAGVALAGAIAALGGLPLECTELAERSRRTEIEDLGIAGGFQDHYAAAFGGALLLTFEGCVGVERLTLSDTTSHALARRSLLVYTGESRISTGTITTVVDACRAHDPRVCGALAHMKALARDMAAALRAGDLDALGALVGEHWTHQRALHPSITTPRIDAIMDAARHAGALGGKALGASGGGCVLVIARDGREDELARALAPLGERLDFAVDHTGFEVVAVMEGENDESASEAGP